MTLEGGKGGGEAKLTEKEIREERVSLLVSFGKVSASSIWA